MLDPQVCFFVFLLGWFARRFAQDDSSVVLLQTGSPICFRTRKLQLLYLKLFQKSLNLLMWRRMLLRC